jgi:anti-anti-sigma factor
MCTTIPPLIPSAQLSIHTSNVIPGTVRVAVAGEIDLSNAGALLAGLLAVLSAQLPERIDVDLAKVTFMDCGGLTVLVAVGKAAARTRCRLRITNPQPIVRRVLDLTGLLDVLTARFDQTPPVATRSASESPIGSTARRVTRSVDLRPPADRSLGTSPTCPPTAIGS